jgi:hypothetical protein
MVCETVGALVSLLLDETVVDVDMVHEGEKSLVLKMAGKRLKTATFSVQIGNN